MSQKFNSEVEIKLINNATSDTAKILVSDGGVVKYRSSSEILEDINAVPYTGATDDVDLGSNSLTARDLIINHSSGSGDAVSISKGGSGEALYVNKTSGSGNAVTVVGGKTSLVDLSLSSVGNSSGDFLTINGGGDVKRRTSAQVLSDIGAAPSTGGSYLPLAGGTLTGLLTYQSGISSDGNSKLYNWRALDNTGGSSGYYRIASIDSTTSSRFTIEIAGRSTGYSDTYLPAYGKIVGQLNNDNNYDIVFYNNSTSNSEVVQEVGQVDNGSAGTHIWIKVGTYAELTATAHISDGTITPRLGDLWSTTSPSGYTVVTEYIDINSGNTNLNNLNYLPLAGGNMSGGIGRTAHNTGHLVGGWNNLGGSGAETSPIYTLGSNFNPNSTTLNDMYGIGYTYAPQASFMTLPGANGWGLYVAADGDARVFLDGETGNISTNGSLYSGGASIGYSSTPPTNGLIVNGNVGIGTTSPVTNLDVNSGNTGISVSSGIIVNGTPTQGGGNSIFLKSSGNTNLDRYGTRLTSIRNSFDNGSADFLISLENASATALVERFRITSEGNVGIGTSNPTSLLHIRGIDPVFRISNSDTSIVDGQTVGEINFNSEDPSTSFNTVIGSIKIKAAGTFDGSINAGGKMILGTYKNVTGLNEAVAIDQFGNVGIGTTNPTTALHIVNTAPIITTNATNGVSGLQLNIVGGSSALFRVYDNNSERIRVTPTGDVGIGTTVPSAKLHVNGGNGILVSDGGIPVLSANSSTGIFVIGDTDELGDGVYVTNTGSSNLDIYSQGSIKVRMDSSGRVGIGNINPSYPLQVDPTVSGISIYASGLIVAYSDQSVKENIRPIENALTRVTKSRGVLYDRTDDDSKNNIGFIAQELEINFPELVVTNPDGTKAVNYQNTVAVLFEAIKEQQKQIQELKQKLL